MRSRPNLPRSDDRVHAVPSVPTIQRACAGARVSREQQVRSGRDERRRLELPALVLPGRTILLLSRSLRSARQLLGRRAPWLPLRQLACAPHEALRMLVPTPRHLGHAWQPAVNSRCLWHSRHSRCSWHSRHSRHSRRSWRSWRRRAFRDLRRSQESRSRGELSLPRAWRAPSLVLAQRPSWSRVWRRRAELRRRPLRRCRHQPWLVTHRVRRASPSRSLHSKPRWQTTHAPSGRDPTRQVRGG